MKDEKRLIAGNRLTKRGAKYAMLRLDDDGILCGFFDDKIQLPDNALVYKCDTKGAFAIPERILAEYEAVGRTSFPKEDFGYSAFKLFVKRVWNRIEGPIVDGSLYYNEIVDISDEEIAKAKPVKKIKEKNAVLGIKECVIYNEFQGIVKVTYSCGAQHLCIIENAGLAEAKSLPTYEECKAEYGKNFSGLPYEKLSYVCSGDEVKIPFYGFDRVVKSNNRYIIIPKQMTDALTDEKFEPAQTAAQAVTVSNIANHPIVKELIKRINALQKDYDRLFSMTQQLQ